MAAQQAAGNMFKEYGGDFFENGGLKKFVNGSENKMNYQQRVTDILRNKGANTISPDSPLVKPFKLDYKAAVSQQNAGSNPNTNVGNTNDNVMGYTRMTADELAYFRGMMRGSNQGNYAPSWQAQSKGNMTNDPAYLKYLQNMGIQDVKWNNKMGMFGPKSKGHVTFRTYYDPKTGKTVTAPNDQAAASGQPDAGQKMQKGPGFIKNLISNARTKKHIKNELKSREKDKMMLAEAEKNKTYAKEADDWFNQRVAESEAYQKHANPNLTLPPRNKTTGMAQPGSFFPQSGFEYGGAPQYNYGGYPQYEDGGYSQYEDGNMYNPGDEAEMTEEEIANYLAMGGTLEYLD
jgi:hypothetical protein